MATFGQNRPVNSSSIDLLATFRKCRHTIRQHFPRRLGIYEDVMYFFQIRVFVQAA
jgi:hypothetical protein